MGVNNERFQQKKGCYWRLATECLRLNGWKWMLRTKCERLQLKCCHRSGNPKLGTEGKVLQLNGYNWRVRTGWLHQKVATEGLGLNSYNWMLQTQSEGLQIKGCNHSLGSEDLGLKCCNWMLPASCKWRVGAKWLLTKGFNRLVKTEVCKEKLGLEGLEHKWCN